MMIKNNDGEILITIFNYTFAFFSPRKLGKVVGIITVFDNGTSSRFVRPVRGMAAILQNAHSELIMRDWNILSRVGEDEAQMIVERAKLYRQNNDLNGYTNALNEFIRANSEPEEIAGCEFG